MKLVSCCEGEKEPEESLILKCTEEEMIKALEYEINEVKKKRTAILDNQASEIRQETVRKITEVQDEFASLNSKVISEFDALKKDADAIEKELKALGLLALSAKKQIKSEQEKINQNMVQKEEKLQKIKANYNEKIAFIYEEEQDKIDEVKREIYEANPDPKPSRELLLKEILRVLEDAANNSPNDCGLSITQIMSHFRPAFMGASNQIIFSLCKTLVEQGKVDIFKRGKTPLFRIIRQEETCETDEIKVKNQVEEPVSEKILKDVYKVLKDAADKYPDNCKLTVLQICGRASSEQCHLYENVSRACEVLTRRGEVKKEQMGPAVVYNLIKNKEE